MLQDFAIIIGLQKYPGLADPANGQNILQGPENDAKNFYEWAASKNGGDVPVTNISLILSSDYPDPVDFEDAKPGFQEVKSVFAKLRKRSEEMNKKGLGTKVGRRLYIFMSGHGITPTQFGINTKEIGLLMCNVGQVNISEVGSYMPGRNLADWFCENEYFDEVFLFMDCCRDPMTVVQQYPVFSSQGVSDKAKKVYAFGTKWPLRAKERVIDNKPQGVFTKTLLMGLGGAGAVPNPNDPETEIITGASLKSFLIQNQEHFMDPATVNNGEKQEPDIDLYPNSNNGTDIIIKTAPLKKFKVVFKFEERVTGNVTIFDSKLFAIQKIDITDPVDELSVALPKGIFMPTGIVNGKQISNPAPFSIKGIEEVVAEVRILL